MYNKIIDEIYEFNPSYYNTIDQIYHSNWVSRRLAKFKSLQRSIDKLWPKGHRTKLVQVAGTSGKGSVCKFLETGLSIDGNTGTFVNPHIFDFRERFSVNGILPEQNDIIEIWENTILPICIEQAEISENNIHTFSEICILIALSLFEKHDVKWAAVETGCGGRYERLTQLKVEASIITNIGYDHPVSLGEKKWQRALDKAGICRVKTPLFTMETDNNIIRIFDSICKFNSSPLYILSDKKVNDLEDKIKYLFTEPIKEDKLLFPKYQYSNAALALEVIKYLLPDLSEDDVLKKFNQIKYFGRSHHTKDNIFIDIAHNPQKMKVLADHLIDKYKSKKKIFIIALSNKRSALEVFNPILNLADNIIITTSSFSGVEPENILEELSLKKDLNCSLEIIKDPKSALKKARSYTDNCNDIIILTGSTYMIDQALNPDEYLRYLNFSYGWRNKDNN